MRAKSEKGRRLCNGCGMGEGCGGGGAGTIEGRAALAVRVV